MQIKSPGKAIRAKCIDCSGGSSEEVRVCTVKKCPLYPFRFGKNPFRTVRVMSEEQRAAARERLAKARKDPENGNKRSNSP
jgi:hypothetical protein